MTLKERLLTQGHIKQCPTCFNQTDPCSSTEDSARPLISNAPSNLIVDAPQGGQLAFSIPDICALTHVGRSTIYVEIKEGRLRIKKVGRRTICLKYDLMDWLNSLPEAN